MKNLPLILLVLLGFALGWLVLPIELKLFDVLTNFSFQYVCCTKTTIAAKISLLFSCVLVLAICSFLSVLISKHHPIAFSSSITIGVIVSIFLSFYAYETSFIIWLGSPFVEATITAMCLPFASVVLSRVLANLSFKRDWLKPAP